jgi:hypothetical protein
LVKNGLIDRQVGIKNGVLMHIGNLHRIVDGYLAGIGDLLTHDDFHQGGLAGTVDAYKGDLLSLGNAKGYI